MTSQLIKMKFESYWVTKLLFDDYYLDFFIDLYKFLHFSDHKSLTLYSDGFSHTYRYKKYMGRRCSDI